MLRPPQNYSTPSPTTIPTTTTTTTTTGTAVSSPLKRLRPSPPITEDLAPVNLLGPTLELPSNFTDHNHKRLVLALQSNLKSELTWSLNALTLLSFREKEDLRRDAVPLAKIPNLLDSLLYIIDQYRDNKGRDKSGDNCDNNNNTGLGFDDEGLLFNLDEDEKMEKMQFAVVASNVLRNFAFVPDNEVIMAQHSRCLETIFCCIEDYKTEDEELVTNALETIVNLAPILNLQTFSSSKPSTIKLTVKQAVQAIMGMLRSPVKTWHCAAAELLGRLIINPDNEQFLSSFAPEMYKRLVDLLGLPAIDAQAASIGALYNLSEVSLDCRLKLVSERWAVDRLLKIIKTPHPVPEVCRKAALTIESLVSEPQNKALLLTYENTFAEILFSEGRHSDTFARILYVLTSRQDSKVATAPAVWGI